MKSIFVMTGHFYVYEVSRVSPANSSSYDDDVPARSVALIVIGSRAILSTLSLKAGLYH